MWSVLEIQQISMGQELANEKSNHLKALKKKFELQLFIRTRGVFQKQRFSASVNK
jgi:hypothetical protein